jgi:hypothetical protein
VGVNREIAAAVGDMVGCFLLNKQGTNQVALAGAAAVGDKLYPAANGFASTTPSTLKPVGVAMEAGSDG